MSVHEIASDRPMLSCIIRRCTLADFEALAQIGAATFLESYAGWLPGRDILQHCRTNHSARAYESLMLHAETAAWVVEVLQAPVGYLVLTAPDFPEHLVQEGDAELKRIYLLSRFASKGLGGELLAQAVRFASNQGRTRMLVGLHRDNLRAYSFYQRHGFVQIGTRTFNVGSVAYTDPVLAHQLS